MIAFLRNKAFPGAARLLNLIKPLDWAILLLGIGITVAITVMAQQGATGTLLVHIESPDGVREYMLDQEVQLVLSGPLGNSEILIKNGLVEFVDSPCRDKLCVHAGRLGQAGAWTACMPNRIFVSIQGESAKTTNDNSVDVNTW